MTFDAWWENTQSFRSLNWYILCLRNLPDPIIDVCEGQFEQAELNFLQDFRRLRLDFDDDLKRVSKDTWKAAQEDERKKGWVPAILGLVVIWLSYTSEHYWLSIVMLLYMFVRNALVALLNED